MFQTGVNPDVVDYENLRCRVGYQVVVTASGPDRPGIVSAVARAVLDASGNVEESRMARLSGRARTPSGFLELNGPVTTAFPRKTKIKRY